MDFSAMVLSMSRVIAGSPEAIAERVQQLELLGINHLILRFTGEWYGETRWISERSMRLFSEQVMPEFSADEHRVPVGVGADAAGRGGRRSGPTVKFVS